VAQIRDVVFDARHPASLARFWAAALDGYDVAPYDDAELARLRAAGIADPEDDPTVLVQPSSGTAPRLWFQRVPESKVVKNRVHLDLACADPSEEAERLTGLGARVLGEQDRWVMMADPEGNEFDVMAD
jgi:Glyoxalase-like domain